MATQLCFIFSPLERWSNLTCAYFSDGLVQPPPSSTLRIFGGKSTSYYYGGTLVLGCPPSRHEPISIMECHSSVFVVALPPFWSINSCGSNPATSCQGYTNALKFHIDLMDSQNTVDERNPATTTVWMHKPPVKNGINSQPQLVSRIVDGTFLTETLGEEWWTQLYELAYLSIGCFRG